MATPREGKTHRSMFIIQKKQVGGIVNIKSSLGRIVCRSLLEDMERENAYFDSITSEVVKCPYMIGTENKFFSSKCFI